MNKILTQAEADALLNLIKTVFRKDTFFWKSDERYDERVIADTDSSLEFVLSLKRNCFEVRLNFRTKKNNVILARVDSQNQHHNPDGSIIRGPHLHLYKEGFGEKYAEPISWYDHQSPINTLANFLSVINTHFPNGFSEDLL